MQMTHPSGATRHLPSKGKISIDPPRREPPRFARLVEKDDVDVRVAQPRLAPHPRLVARSMLERNAATRELLDPFVEVVALEIDGGGRDDLFVWVDLHRKRRSAARLEAGVIGWIVDDLLEAEPLVEID